MAARQLKVHIAAPTDWGRWDGKPNPPPESGVKGAAVDNVYGADCEPNSGYGLALCEPIPRVRLVKIEGDVHGPADCARCSRARRIFREMGIW